MGSRYRLNHASGDARQGFAFAEAVLGSPLSGAEALAAVRARRRTRASLFLDTIERAVFAHGPSPYRSLLDAAGYDLGRIRRLVQRRGVQATLAQLCRAGVYVSIEEFKGLREARRGRRSFRFSDQAFLNPLIAGGFSASSGGTRTDSITSTISSSNLRMGAEHLVLALAAYGLQGCPMMVWLPQAHGASYWAVLAFAATGAPRVEWFTQLPDRSPKATHTRLFRRAVWSWSRTRGIQVARPRHVGLGRESVIIEAIKAEPARRWGVFTTPSSALRLVLAARQARTGLHAVTFITVGEPLTHAKLTAIHRAGARAFSSLGFTEFGRATYGCATAESDQMHVCSDAVAVVRRRRPVDEFGSEVDALLFTSLLPDARKILLNVETGDYAAGTTSGACGCLLESAGWTERFVGIQSFEKLNAEGRRFFGSQLISLVEEVLPGRFGGTSTDYQLVEQEDHEGFTRLYILVHPRLGAVAESEVLACAEERLQASHAVGSTLWKEAGTVRLRRSPPIVTRAGKLMALHHLGSAALPRT